MLCTFAMLVSSATGAAEYDIVPRFSTLTLSGHGVAATSGRIDYDLPWFGAGHGTFDVGGELTFTPAPASLATAAVGGSLTVERRGGALALLGASIVPLIGDLSPSGKTAWTGGMGGHVSPTHLELADELLKYLRVSTSLSEVVTPSSVLVSLGGAAPVGTDGTFDTASLMAAVTGAVQLVGIPNADADWSSAGLALDAATGWVGGRDDGTLILPITLHWQQRLALPPQSFGDVVHLDLPLNVRASYDATLDSGTLEMDWTLSGTLLAVLAPAPVPEPSTAWLSGAGLLALAAWLRSKRPPSPTRRFKVRW
jgi:hypothetical protein